MNWSRSIVIYNVTLFRMTPLAPWNATLSQVAIKIQVA